jgi:hypothetical protein
MVCPRCLSANLVETQVDANWFPGKEYVRDDNDCPELVPGYFCRSCDHQWAKPPGSRRSWPKFGDIAALVMLLPFLPLVAVVALIDSLSKKE